MKNVDGPAVRLVDETDERLAELLPDTLAIQLGGIAEACRDGLMAVAVEAGLATAVAIMNEEADALCGAWNARDSERDHVRGGTSPTSVVMGGQRLPLRRPRVHAVDDDGDRTGEVPLTSYGVFAQGDLLTRVAMERMLAGVATRSFTRAADPIGDKARKSASSTSKSAVSRRFVTGTAKALDTLVGRDLSSLDAAVLITSAHDRANRVARLPTRLHAARPPPSGSRPSPAGWRAWLISVAPPAGHSPRIARSRSGHIETAPSGPGRRSKLAI